MSLFPALLACDSGFALDTEVPLENGDHAWRPCGEAPESAAGRRCRATSSPLATELKVRLLVQVSL